MKLKRRNQAPTSEPSAKRRGPVMRALGRLLMATDNAGGYKTANGRNVLAPSIAWQEASGGAAEEPRVPGKLTDAELERVIGTEQWRRARSEEKQTLKPGTVDHPVIGRGDDWRRRLGESAGATWPEPAPAQPTRPNSFQEAHDQALRRAVPSVLGGRRHQS